MGLFKRTAIIMQDGRADNVGSEAVTAVIVKGMVL
jgi:hypothetical protein